MRRPPSTPEEPAAARRLLPPARRSIGLENTHGHAPPDAVRYQFLVLLLGHQKIENQIVPEAKKPGILCSVRALSP